MSHITSNDQALRRAKDYIDAAIAALVPTVGSPGSWQLLFEKTGCNFSAAGNTNIPKAASAPSFTNWRMVQNGCIVVAQSGVHDAAGVWNISVNTPNFGPLNLLSSPTTNSWSTPGSRHYSQATTSTLLRENLDSVVLPQLQVTTPMAGAVVATVRLYGLIIN